MDFSQEDKEFAQNAGQVVQQIGKSAVEIQKTEKYRETNVNPFLMSLLEEWAIKHHFTRSQALDLALLIFLKDHTAFNSTTAGFLGIDDEVVGAMQEEE